MRSAKRFLMLLLLCAGLIWSPACSGSRSKSDSAIPVAERIPVTYMCSHEKHENFIAAYGQSKEKLEQAEKAILNVNRKLRDADTEVLRRIGIAQAIDTAIALRDMPNKTGDFAAAYGKHAKNIESLAESNWKTLDPTPEQTQALREVTMADSRDVAAAFQKAYQPALTGQFAAMYRENQEQIELILRQDQHLPELDAMDSRALELVQSGHMIDVASAAISSDPSTRAPSVAEAYRAGEAYLRTLAQKKPSDKSSPEEQHAVCLLLRAYQGVH